MLVGVPSAFDEIILRTEVHGFASELLVIAAGHHHDRNRVVRLLQLPQRRETVRVGEVEVEEDDVVDGVAQRAARGSDSVLVGDVGDFRGFPAQRELQKFCILQIVFDDQ